MNDAAEATNPPPPYIREDVARFLGFLNMLNAPTSRELGQVLAREQMVANVQLSDLPIGELAVMRDIMVTRPDGSPLAVRLFDARETRLPGPALVFFHGGGWVLGDLDTHAAICAEIARMLDLPVLAVDYRLAPENPWPAGPDDCEMAARWVAGSPAELGRAITGLVLMGDSAGGTLTIVTAMALRDAPAAVPVLAQCPCYPAVDRAPAYPSYALFAKGYFLTHEGMQWFDSCYRADLDHWRGAPIRGNQAGMPPTLVVTAGLDPLRDQGRAYAAQTIAAGVTTIYREAAGTVHGFLNLRAALPSAIGDVGGLLVALKALIAESGAAQILAQAATEPLE